MVNKGLLAGLAIAGGIATVAAVVVLKDKIIPPGNGNGNGNGNGPGPTPGKLIENFSISVTSGLVPLTVGFSLELSRGFKTIEWNFDDGADLNKLIVSHTYRSAGVFNGFVKVVDKDDFQEIRNFQIVVTNPPIICDPGFHLENGMCVMDMEPPIECDPGFHNENGVCVPDLPPPPKDLITNFFQSTGVIIQNQSVSFSIAIGIPSLEIEEIRWHFGDGSTDVFGLQAVDHTYASKGTFGGHVVVTDINGKFEKRTFSVLVQPDPIVEISARIILSGFSGSLNVGEQLRAFADVSGGVAPLDFKWNMGDGTILFGQDVTHIYDTEGTKQIQLTVTDSKGTVETVGKPISVSFKPIQVGDVLLSFKTPVDISDFSFDGTDTFFRLNPIVTIQNLRSDRSIFGDLLLRVFDFRGNQLTSLRTPADLAPNGLISRNFTTKILCSCDTPFIVRAEYQADGIAREIAVAEIRV